MSFIEKKYIGGLIFSRVFNNSSKDRLNLWLIASLCFFLLAPSLQAQFIENQTNTSDITRETTSDPKVDIVRGLRAQLVKNRADAISLSWVPSGVPGEYIIARSRNPISTKALLLSSESVGIVKPGVSSFVDSGVNQGKYYYAVGSKAAIKSGKIFLYAGENYTTIGVEVRAKRITSNSNSTARLPPQISLIYAQRLSNQDIRISWRGIKRAGITYVIYRSTEKLSDAQAMNRADRLAMISNGAEFFIDRKLPGPGDYYYAITTRNSQGGEDKNLLPDQSYTRKPIRSTVIDLPVTGYINATRRGPNSIAVEWRDIVNAQSQNYSYLLYRSTQPIRTLRELRTSERLGSIQPGVQYYLDTNLPEGQYHYAIITRNEDNRRSSALHSGQNTTISSVSLTSSYTNRSKTTSVINEITVPKGQKVFVDFAAYNRNGHVLLSWKSTSFIMRQRNSKVALYRFKGMPKDINDLVHAKLLDRVDTEQVLYEDSPPKNGVYYYALFLRTPRGLAPKFLETDHNLIGPISFNARRERQYKEEPYIIAKKKKKKKRKKTANSNALNRIIKSTYLRGDYQAAVIALRPYTTNASKRLKAKALFYMALSEYKLNRFENALENLVHPLVVRAYGKRAKFWYQRTLEHIK